MTPDKAAGGVSPQPHGYWQLRVEHARKQGAADGFQQGWHAALSRIDAGDSTHELRSLVPVFDALGATSE